ncbi:endonuclease/exonuclease/phosphatase family protein [Jannaschia sp. Os4]|uniref:endonuclease/exonuclease/phosphatase family protein n=1 Tax=Jannaschia sp. Os4 TaxID=2807617 RepID=UPI0019394189|nr:endonuclease/exonuclease/phosphatase family protein [Jannaschia sp. Os4]MBM2577699.1 endonuclease/exonuclease/phosphatase family protein [Jannaschia sp. Os4]
MMRGLLRLLGWGSAALLLLGFVGRWSPAADSLSILRPYAALGCAAASVLMAGRSRIVLAALAAAGAATIVLPFLGQAPVPGPTLYSKNLLAGNTAMEGVAADILAADPDFVLLQEVGDANLQIIDLLAERWSHAHLCRNSAWSGVAVLSKAPFAGETACTERRAVAAAPVSWKGETVWIAALHIPWPWPNDYGVRTEPEAIAFLAALPGPVIAAGDVNQMPWSHRARALARAADGRVRTTWRPTFWLKRTVPLPIDMVMAPHGAEVLRRPKLGSDHHGLLARVAWPG